LLGFYMKETGKRVGFNYSDLKILLVSTLGRFIENKPSALSSHNNFKFSLLSGS